MDGSEDIFARFDATVSGSDNTEEMEALQRAKYTQILENVKVRPSEERRTEASTCITMRSSLILHSAVPTTYCSSLRSSQIRMDMNDVKKRAIAEGIAEIKAGQKETRKGQEEVAEKSSDLKARTNSLRERFDKLHDDIEESLDKVGKN